MSRYIYSRAIDDEAIVFKQAPSFIANSGHKLPIRAYKAPLIVIDFASLATAHGVVRSPIGMGGKRLVLHELDA